VTDFPTFECGYCGNEFKNLNHPHGKHPCPQCRSWKVEEKTASEVNQDV